MFVNTRNPYMFRSFLFDHPQGAIRRALCRSCNVFSWFAFVEYLLGMWPYVYIICLCVRLVLLSVEDLFVNSSQTGLPLTRAPSTHTHTNRWYTHTATCQTNTQRRHISGRYYGNGIWPPEDGPIKRTETCRALFVFTNMFSTF